ncbi:hypothetical protein M514_01820 [Trichuris suis]|uniref:Phosphoglycerate mutase family protein n=1 Tax=Trichuris suis TaxID=68888 RepID=A0A085MJB3_9BILA|nr:hypothetical protein M513_01820 [Trichuris suis]KFD72694.1 hypothetical protein M514_01820 [Trichuris suis]
MVNGRRIRSSLPSGITDLNATNVLQGHTDSPLNSLGRWQASRLGEYFAESGAVFTAAFSSDLIRAVETVQLILEKQPCSNKPVNVQKDPALRERHYGSYEGTKTAKFLAEAKKRGVKPEFYTPDTVEPVPKLAERIENWFQRCWHSARENDSLLVVAHGGSIRRLFAYFYDSLKCEFAAERGRVVAIAPNTAFSIFLVRLPKDADDKQVVMRCEALHEVQHLSGGSVAK